MANGIKLADQGYRHLIFTPGERPPVCGNTPVSMRVGADGGIFDSSSRQERLYQRDKNFHTYWITRPLGLSEGSFFDKLKAVLE